MIEKSFAVPGIRTDDLSLPEPTPEHIRWSLLNHLQYSVGKSPEHASKFDWRMALSYAIRDRAVNPWFASTRRTWPRIASGSTTCRWSS